VLYYVLKKLENHVTVFVMESINIILQTIMSFIHTWPYKIAAKDTRCTNGDSSIPFSYMMGGQFANCSAKPNLNLDSALKWQLTE
jgi:hypothetical protein